MGCITNRLHCTGLVKSSKCLYTAAMSMQIHTTHRSSCVQLSVVNSIRRAILIALCASLPVVFIVSFPGHGYEWDFLSLEPVGDVSSGASICRDTIGTLHLARISSWQDSDGVYYEVGYQVQDGTEWNRESVYSLGTIRGNSVYLALDSSDAPHIVFSVGNVIHYARQVLGAWETEETPYTIYTSGGIDADSGIAVDSTGRVHLVCSGSGVKYAYRDGTGWHDVSIPGTTTSNIRYISIVVDSNDYPHILNSVGGCLNHAYQDASGWHAECAVPVLSRDCFAAIDAADQIYVSYLSDGLRLATWDGFAWSDELVVASETSDLQAFVALDASGSPYLTYGHDLDWGRGGLVLLAG